jgi:hypothetical protein
MPNLDTGLNALSVAESRGTRRALGAHLMLYLAAALSSTSLKVAAAPGEVVIDHRVAQLASAEAITVYSGSTLADGSSISATLVAYWDESAGKVKRKMVEGAAATTGSQAAPTDAAIETSCGTDAFVKLGSVTFSRSGSAISVSLDHTVRPQGVYADAGWRASGADEAPAGAIIGGSAVAALYRPWGKICHSVDAADIANGDVLTELPLPRIYGKVSAWRVVCEKAISTGAKTATLNLEIGTTNITDATLVYAGTKALGVVTAGGAPSAANTFVPGDTLSIEAASVTSFVEGRVCIEIDIDARVDESAV